MFPDLGIERDGLVMYLFLLAGISERDAAKCGSPSFFHAKGLV
jgi:hypothetical protein